MLYKKSILSSIVVATLLFTGCSSSEDADSEKKQDSAKVSVVGKSSLSDARLCVDVNRDNICQEDEAFTTTQEDGSFELTYDASASKDAALVAQKGFNLITLQENSQGMVLVGSLDEEASHNVNTFTTLIQAAVDNNLNYDEAKASVAVSFNLDETYIDQDPLVLLADEERHDYFLTVRAIEAYAQKEKNSQESLFTDELFVLAGYEGDELPSSRSAQRSVKQEESTVMTMESAQTAVESTNIYAFDLEAYLHRLGELVVGFFQDLFSYFGIDWGDTYQFNVTTLDPYVARIYDQNITLSGDQDKNTTWNFVDMMRGDDEAAITKNYKDLDYIFTHTQHEETWGIITMLYALIGTDSSVSKFLEVIDRSYLSNKITRLDVAIGLLIATQKTERDGTFERSNLRFEQAYLYEEYFKNSKNLKFKEIIGNGVVNLSQPEGLHLVLDYIKAHYISSPIKYDEETMPTDYTAENRIAENLTHLFKYFNREVAYTVLVDFYDETNDVNLHSKLRKAYAYFANETTTEKLFALASKLPVLIKPVQGVKTPAQEYLDLFTTVERNNKNLAFFVIVTLDDKYTFGDENLKANIIDIFDFIVPVEPWQE